MRPLGVALCYPRVVRLRRGPLPRSWEAAETLASDANERHFRAPPLLLK